MGLTKVSIGYNLHKYTLENHRFYVHIIYEHYHHESTVPFKESHMNVKCTDAYMAAIKQRIMTTISDEFSCEYNENAVLCPARGRYLIRSSAPQKHGADALAWAHVLNEKREKFGNLFGVPFIKSVCVDSGQLAFVLTDDYYTAALLHAKNTLDKPKALYSGDDVELCAFWRMKMLARKGGESCPPYPSIQRAAFLSLAIVSRLGDNRALKLRLQEASQALLTMTHFAERADRSKLFNMSGLVGDAASRLIYMGIKAKELEQDRRIYLC